MGGVGWVKKRRGARPPQTPATHTGRTPSQTPALEASPSRVVPEHQIRRTPASAHPETPAPASFSGSPLAPPSLTGIRQRVPLLDLAAAAASGCSAPAVHRLQPRPGFLHALLPALTPPAPAPKSTLYPHPP